MEQQASRYHTVVRSGSESEEILDSEGEQYTDGPNGSDDEPQDDTAAAAPGVAITSEGTPKVKVHMRRLKFTPEQVRRIMETVAPLEGTELTAACWELAQELQPQIGPYCDEFTDEDNLKRTKDRIWTYAYNHGGPDGGRKKLKAPSAIVLPGAAAQPAVPPRMQLSRSPSPLLQQPRTPRKNPHKQHHKPHKQQHKHQASPTTTTPAGRAAAGKQQQQPRNKQYRRRQQLHHNLAAAAKLKGVQTATPSPGMNRAIDITGQLDVVLAAIAGFKTNTTRYAAKVSGRDDQGVNAFAVAGADSIVKAATRIADIVEQPANTIRTIAQALRQIEATAAESAAGAAAGSAAAVIVD